MQTLAASPARPKVIGHAFELLLQRTRLRVEAGVRSRATLHMHEQNIRYLLEHIPASTPIKRVGARMIHRVLMQERAGRRKRNDGSLREITSNTLRHRACTLRQALKLACRRLPPFPELPYRYQPCNDFLEVADYERMRDALEPHRRLWFVLATWTGQRHGDVERMVREDLDVDERWVMIRSTKTYRTKRRFHAAPELLTELEAHWRSLPPGARLVAPWPHAGSALSRLSERLGMRLVTPHRLRHTFFTWYVGANGFTAELLELGGWKDLTIPSLVYAHAAPARLQEQIERTHQLVMRSCRAPRKVPASAIPPAKGSGGPAATTAEPPKPAHDERPTRGQDEIVPDEKPASGVVGAEGIEPSTNGLRE